MRKSIGFMAAIAVGCAVNAQAVEETVLGYLNNGVSIPSNTDVIASVPFTGTPVFDGTVSSANAAGVTINGAAFTTDQYKDLYYVRVRSGVDSGLWSTVTSNNATTVFTADDLSTAPVGGLVEIVKHQTLNSLFPAALANVAFVPSTSTSGLGRKTTVNLITLPSTIGVNRAPGSGGTYFFFSGTWRKTTATGTDAGNTVLVPQQYYVIRNTAASQTLTLLTAGAINPPTIATYTYRGSTAAGQNDNPLGTGRYVDMSLNDTGLGGSSAFQDSTGTSGLARRDTIQLFDNTATGLNKAPGSAGTFFRFSGTWRKTTATSVDVSTNILLQAGTGFVIRKYTNSVSQTEVWAESNNQ